MGADPAEADRWWESARASAQSPHAAEKPAPEVVDGYVRAHSDDLGVLEHAVAAQPPRAATALIASVLQAGIAVAVLVACLVLGHAPFDEHAVTLGILVALLTFPGVNRFRQRPARAALGVLRSWGLCIAVLCGIAWWIPGLRQLDLHLLLVWTVLTPVAQWLAVVTGRSLIRRWATRPERLRSALIVGGGVLAARVARVIEARSEYGQRLVGFVEDRAPQRRAYQTVGRVVGGFADVAECVRRYGVRDVYLALPLGQQARLLAVLDSLRSSGVSVYYVPDVFGVPVLHGRLQALDGLPLVGLLESPFVGVDGLVKRASDVVLGALILVLISPLLLVLAVGVALTSPGPVIFRQRRNGLDGREIMVYKFRSMTATDNGPVVRQATRNDARITRFGAFLRRTSLDELPQFFNVLQGTMSIVGPRPHAVAHNEQYRRIIDAYMLRHKIKPGITGWAQVNGHRGETDQVEKMAARVACDIDYLHNWSFTLDLRIMARTILLLCFDRSAY